VDAQYLDDGDSYIFFERVAAIEGWINQQRLTVRPYLIDKTVLVTAYPPAVPQALQLSSNFSTPEKKVSVCFFPNRYIHKISSAAGFLFLLKPLN
jgi:hypothetical protein